MSEQVLKATTMARAVLSDPQFTLPTRPRMVPGLVRVLTESGLIVDGGPSRQYFQGKSAQRLLPRLMDALDGTRDPETLARELRAERPALLSAISLLYTTGLLEQADSPTTEMVTPSLRYLARSIDTTRVNPSGVAAYQRLSTAHVVIAADEAYAAVAGELTDALIADHVGRVTILDPTDPVLAGDTTLLLTLGSCPVVEAAGLHAREVGIATLPAQHLGDSLRVGPLLDARHAACISCLIRQRDCLLSDPATSLLPPDGQFAVELLAREVLAIISRVGTAFAANSMMTVDLNTWEQRSYAIAPRVQCPICMDPVRPDPDHGTPLSWAYAHMVSFAPRESINPKDHQVHYKSGNLALQQSHRRWLSSPVTELPPSVSLDDGRSDRLDVAAVATVLRLTFGLRNGISAGPGRVDRWCATGGNLGSTTGYLIARDVEGLAPGVYGYQREQDNLARLTWSNQDADLAGILPTERAVLVITGALDTVAPKYGPFAWHILHLDTGAALAQAHLVAGRIGLTARPRPVWDDVAIADLLGADRDCEPVTAVLPLRTIRLSTSGVR